MERRFSIQGRQKLLVPVIAFVLILGIGWTQRSSLTRWYTVRGLAHADPSTRQAWAERVAKLSPPPIESLLDHLRAGDPLECGNIQAGLAQILETSTLDEAVSQQLTNRLAQLFATTNPAGQRVVVQTQAAVVRACPAIGMSALPMLTAATDSSSEEVRGQAILLANALLDHCSIPEVGNAIKTTLEAGLRDASAENRLQAVRLGMNPRVNAAGAVAALLTDSSPEVRRAAMLAVGPNPDVLSADELLAWLHDSDEEVRKLCEKALRSRGLQDDHVKLGRLMTDIRPAARLQVVEQLRQANDLEPAVWLRRLTHDPSPAIRAAAVRAACEQKLAQLADRVEQMAQTDPSPTVRQLAQYYLSSQKSAPGINE